MKETCRFCHKTFTTATKEGKIEVEHIRRFGMCTLCDKISTEMEVSTQLELRQYVKNDIKSNSKSY